MSAPQPRGWCPSLFEPMQAADGWLLRVKPRRATLSADAARCLAAAAALYGNGFVTLTNRANLQLRGVAEQGIGAAAETMLRAGLADADPGAERRRNLLTPPLLGDDPALPGTLFALIAGLEAMLAAPDPAGLPAKFGLLVDGGARLGLERERADIRVRLEGEIAFVALDGDDVAARCSPREVPAVAGCLTRAFLPLSAGAVAVRRMRDLVAAVGAGAVFAAAGLATNAVLPAAPASRDRVGFLGYPGTDRGAFGVALPFGRLRAGALEALAGLAERHGDGTLRVSPWRVLLLPGIAAGDSAAVAREAAALGGIVEPGDRRLSLEACVGRPACARATVATEADAAELLVAGLPDIGLIHLSGCAKGCAHPGAAAITLVGESGRYGLVRNGGADGTLELAGLTIQQVAEALRGRHTCAA